MRPTPPTPDKRTFEIADRLSRIELGRDIEAFGPQVIEIMAAAGDSFRIIDPRPCYFNELNGRFWMLRSVRNHPVWGPRLFQAVARKRPRQCKPSS